MSTFEGLIIGFGLLLFVAVVIYFTNFKTRGEK